ncbi:MAG: hypothetical protein ACHQ4G_09435 [Opitutales bacterium]
MNKYLLAGALMLVGIILIFQGKRRADSLVGVSAKFGTQVAEAVDGRSRAPEYFWYYVGGSGLILYGLGVILRKRSGN